MDYQAMSGTYLGAEQESGQSLSFVEFEDGRCALVYKGRVIAGPWNDADVAEASRAFRLAQAETAARASPS